MRVTRFAWLKALPEALGKKNLLALLDRLLPGARLRLRSRRRERIHPDRRRQPVRKLAGPPCPSRCRPGTPGAAVLPIAAQLIEPGPG